jgi:hypothetical protein
LWLTRKKNAANNGENQKLLHDVILLNLKFRPTVKIKHFFANNTF